MLLPSLLGYCCRRRGDAGNACSHVLVHSCTRMGGKAVGRGFTVHGQGSSGSGSAHQRLNKILSPPLHSLGSHCPRTLPAPGQHEPCVLVLPEEVRAVPGTVTTRPDSPVFIWLFLNLCGCMAMTSERSDLPGHPPDQTKRKHQETIL